MSFAKNATERALAGLEEELTQERLMVCYFSRVEGVNAREWQRNHQIALKAIRDQLAYEADSIRQVARYRGGDLTFKIQLGHFKKRKNHLN
jgi:hypothetical protein